MLQTKLEITNQDNVEKFKEIPLKLKNVNGLSSKIKF